jgi:hypothetical protein
MRIATRADLAVAEAFVENLMGFLTWHPGTGVRALGLRKCLRRRSTLLEAANGSEATWGFSP